MLFKCACGAFKQRTHSLMSSSFRPSDEQKCKENLFISGFSLHFCNREKPSSCAMKPFRGTDAGIFPQSKACGTQSPRFLRGSVQLHKLRVQMIFGASRKKMSHKKRPKPPVNVVLYSYRVSKGLHRNTFTGGFYYEKDS